MKAKWPEKILGDVTSNFDSQRIPVSARERERRHGKYPYYGATGIMDYIDDYLFDGLYLLVAEDGSVETKRGTPFLQLVDGRFWVNNHAHVIKGETDTDTRYLFYALSTIKIRPFMTGSVQAKLSQGNLNRISIPYLSRSERHAIAAILGALDDKIELNRRMNQTLETIAQALFKSWFIDFESCRDQVMEESPMGPIPSAWRVGSFGDIISEKRERIGEHQAIVLSAVSKGELVQSDEHFNKRVYSKNINKYLRVEQWDFAYNPSRINIGSIGMLKESLLGAVSPVYVVFRPNLNYHWFIDFTLRQNQVIEWIVTLSSGSVRQSLTFNDFAIIPCVIPPAEFAQAFTERWNIILSMIENNKETSATIGNIRDTLLPKLLSGEIRVKDTEKFVEVKA